MTRAQKHNAPALRFPEYIENWSASRLEELLVRVGEPISVEKGKLYREIGIRSHGKGIFHKEQVCGQTIGSKRVFAVHVPAFIVNIVFAWEHAIAVTTCNEKGFIASHRFPMFVPIQGKASLEFTKYFFLRKYGKHLLGLASPGGAGRNKTLGQRDFSKLNVVFPNISEQRKVASFLSSVDKKIKQLERKKQLLEQYKNGCLQKVFSQDIRFKDDQGNDFPDWREKCLKEILIEHKSTNKDNKIDEVFSVAKHKGVINQIEHLGRSYAAASISHYKVVYPFDVIYTKSPTRDFPFGIIKQNLTGRAGVVSPLYAVLRPANKNAGFILHNYFESCVNTYNYLNPLVQKGAKNTMSIRNDDFLNGAKIGFPSSEHEQQKIADYLSSVDRKIDLVSTELDHAKTFKKGLLQQMFI